MSDIRLRVTAEQAAAFRLARHHLGQTRAPLRRGSSARSTPHRADVADGSKRTAATPSDAGTALSIADVVRDSAGIQAQVQSSAEMAIWTRRRSTSRDDVSRALWQTRELVKTSAMRLTLHLVPAADFAMYIAAMRASSSATLARWQARLRITPAHVRSLIETVVDSLADGALTQQALVSRAKQRAPKSVRAWLDHAWSAVRPAVIEGAIVYGPPRGAEATFVRADTWLGGVDEIDADAARAELLRRFLHAFGPATAHDFAKWSGLKVSEARTIVDGVAGELAAISVDGAPGWVMAGDVDALRRSELDAADVRLLGPFDSFLLAHATKEHLVSATFYKKVYRAQGWISAVVLRGGSIAGTWTQRRDGKSVAIDVQLFGRESAAVRRAIEAEAAALSAFVGAPCAARFS